MLYMDTCVGQMTIVMWTHLDRAGGNAAPQGLLQAPPGISCLPARVVLGGLAGRASRDGVAIAVVRARQGLLGLLHSTASIRGVYLIYKSMNRISERARNRLDTLARPS